MLGIFSSALLYYLWAGRYSYFHFPVLVMVEITCLGLILLSHFLFPADSGSLGLRFSNFFQGGKFYGGMSLSGCLLIAAIGWNNPDLNFRIAEEAPAYLAWAAIQQYALQNFFLRLALVVFTPHREVEPARPGVPMSGQTRILASLLAASAFSLFHFPSPVFAVVTFAAAFFWCLVYTRLPNFYWAWGSHFMLGICLSFFLKTGLMGQLQVGPGGFRYEAYGDGVSVAAGYGSRGEPFIAAVPGPDRGNASLVRVFTPGGELLAEWKAFPEFDFSAMIAAGDAGFGPGDEIIAVPGPGPDNPPVVRIFTPGGNLLKEIRISDPEFPQSYGAWAGVSGGKLYLGPGPGPRAPQILAEYSPAGELLRKWSLPEGGALSGAGLFHNGIRGVVKGEVDPLLLSWGSGISVNPSIVAISDTAGNRLSTLETLPTTFGVNLALVELGDKGWGIAAGPGPLRGYPPWIKVFAAGEGWRTVSDMAPWEDEGSCGINLSAVDIDGDGVDELVAGEGWGKGRPARVRVLSIKGEILHQWEAF